MTRVSVIIPCLNAVRFIGESLGSVAAQTFSDWEIVVADDGSTDGTLDVLAQWRGRLGDRLRILPGGQAARGAGAARNRAAAASGGEYLAFLDADDMWLPTKLAEQIPLLENSPPVDLAFAQAFCVDAEQRPVDPPPATGGWPAGIIGDAPHAGRVTDAYAGTIRQAVFAPCLTVVVRRAAFERAGGFPEQLDHQVEDAVLWARIGRRSDFVFQPRVLALYRVHAGSWTITQTRLSHLDGRFEIYRTLAGDTREVPPVLRHRLHRLVREYLNAPAPPAARLRAARRVAFWLAGRRLLDPSLLFRETAAALRDRTRATARRLLPGGTA
ncbi:MAG TPA: glycosyltransferase [bacterium]|jgi:glycosyltransferase involved in cell wall biosynthesis